MRTSVSFSKAVVGVVIGAVALSFSYEDAAGQQSKTFNRPGVNSAVEGNSRRTEWPTELTYNPNDPANESLSGLPLAARREIIRRQHNITEAQNAVTRGDTARFVDGDLDTAVSEYRKGLDLIPDAPMTKGVRANVAQKYADTSVELAEVRIEEGRYPEAISLLEAVLAPHVAPKHAGAKSLLEKLNDPEYFNQALTPEHQARVKLVEEALIKAMGYYDLGDFDSAEEEYHKVLNIDRFNSGARRGLEQTDREVTKYYDSAYDENRARYLREVMAAWETKVPEFGLEGGLDGTPRDGAGVRDGVAYNKAKLKAIIIPRVEFTDTPLGDAIEYLRQKSVELDTMEPDPARKGLNIIIQNPIGGGAAAAAPKVDEFGFSSAPGAAPAAGGGSSPGITLTLNNIPLVEALRYTTEQAQRKVKVEAFAVKIVPLTDVGNELLTKVYRVPPNFLNLGGGGGGGGAAPDDPFAAPAAGGGGGSQLTVKPTAKVVLEDKGITFANGSSAFFNPSTSQLVVRNTQTNLELIDTFVDSIQEEVQKQLTITTRFVEIQQNNREELGMDWLLGTGFIGNPFEVGSGIVAGGGTTGNVRPGGLTAGSSTSDFPTRAGTPVGGGLRSGAVAIAADSIDGAITNSTTGSVTGTAGTGAAAQQLAPAIFGIAGGLGPGSPSFAVVLRGLSQKKGVDLVTAPTVTARSGQRAEIQVIREFIYPTEYDPPDIPNTTNGLSFPVTPANPTAFETKSVGTTLEVDPVIGADGYTIDLNLVPEVVEFDGFLNYGSPITVNLPGVPFLPGNLFALVTGANVLIPPPGVPPAGATLLQPTLPAAPQSAAVLSQNRIVMPVFSARRATTAVTVWDGQTVVIGGLIREDVQSVRDKVPIFGDLPLVGRLFRHRADQTLKRNLNILVTPKLIDPAGQPIRDFDSLVNSSPEDLQ